MSETLKYWLKDCDMAFLLLNFIAAEKNSDWFRHLENFTEMLMYDTAYEHKKYMIWGLAFYMICMNSQRNILIFINYFL